jgi:hypothetical protein
VKKEVRLLFPTEGKESWQAVAAVADGEAEGSSEAEVTAYFRSMHREVLAEPIPQNLLDAIAPLRRR